MKLLDVDGLFGVERTCVPNCRRIFDRHLICDRKPIPFWLRSGCALVFHALKFCAKSA